MQRRRHVYPLPTWTPPASKPEPALLEGIMREIFAQARALERLDDEIGRMLRTIEAGLDELGIRQVIRVRLDDETTLGWSARNGRWRLVIVDEHPDGQAIAVLDASRDERAWILGTNALARLVEQAIALKGNA